MCDTLRKTRHNTSMRLLRSVLYGTITVAAVLAAQTPPPKEWIDPDTGHRVVRLTDEPGSASRYFNQNGYTADGK